MSLIQNVLAGYDVLSPTGTITATSGTAIGSMDAGNYQYKVTYVTLFGETLASGASVSASSSGSMNLSTIPVSTNSEVVTKNLYRTTVGNITPFKFLATINNANATYIDILNDGSLGSAEPYANWASSSQRCQGWTGFSKPVVYSTANITAAGLTRETATLAESEFSYCDVPVDLNGIILPAIKDNLIGQKFTINNIHATNQLSLYPALVTESIGGGAPGAAFIMGPNSSLEVLSTGSTTWTTTSAVPSLADGLVSIGNLTTAGNEMLYTVASNTYATTPISAAGRSFVSAGSQLDQRAAIGVVIGTDVQAHSTVLDSVDTIGSGVANNLLYTTGGGISNTLIDPFVRTTLLPASSAGNFRNAIDLDYLPANPNGGFDLSSDIVIGQNASQTLNNKTIDANGGTNTLTIGANTTFDGITFSAAGSTTNGNILTVVGGTLQLAAPVGGGDVVGPGSATDNALARFNLATGKLIQNSGIIVDDSNNITGVAALTATGTISGTTLAGTLSTAAQPNVTSLGTLSTVTVSGVSTLNGGALIPTGFDLTLTDAPTIATDAANKAYVDSVASAGGAPLTGAQGATTTVLPNTPTYSSSAGTLTAVGAVTTLTIDGVSYTASDGKRLLVKDQVDPRQNGVYTRTADSGGNWQLTRVTDLDAPAEAVQNTTIFIEGGTVNTNTSWTLQETVTQFDPPLATPGTSDVIWVQTSGSQNLQAGTGMTQTGNTFNVNGTASRISATATAVDIDAAYVGQASITTLGTIGTGTWNGTAITPTYGGSGLSDPTADNVLITAGAGSMTLKSNPAGAFVGTTDAQTLTNKILESNRVNTASTVFANTNITANTLNLDTTLMTAARTITVPDATDTMTLNGVIQTLTNKTMTSNTNNIIGRAMWTGSGTNSVSTYASSDPSIGQVLTATGVATATWQTPSTFTPARTLFVYQGASDVSPNFSTVAGAIAAASALTPATTNWVSIEMYPGLYTESIPITIPEFVSISGLTAAQSSVQIRPTAPAAASAVFITNGNARLMGIVLECADGSGGYATIGIQSVRTLGAGTPAKLDLFNNITTRNASSACFQCDGNAIRRGHIALYKSCSAQVTVIGHTVAIGYEVKNAGLVTGIDLNASGFFISGFSGQLTDAFYVHDDHSYMDVNIIQPSVCVNAVRVGGGTTSNSQYDYPTFRGVGANCGEISGIGLLLEEKSGCRVSDFKIEDNSGLYPNQVHIQFNSPSLPAEPNFIAAMFANARFDKLVFAGPGALTNPPQIRGLTLSEIPGEIQNNFQGEVTIGLPGNGSEISMGEGDSHTIGLIVLQDDGGAFTDVTLRVNNPISNQIAVNLASVAAIDIASAPATIDGVIPTLGVTRVLIKDGSTVNPGITSVDNGIYVWNGTGNAMTRASDFASGNARSHQTWFVVDVGTVNYGSAWKLDGGTILNGEEITIGTTAWGVEPKSIQVFPAVPVNNDALYIGATNLLQFQGIKLSNIKVITATAAAASDVLDWEYWNGSIWTALPFMTTEADAPYENEANESFGFGDTLISPNIDGHHVRFGDILSSWMTNTINGTLAYWIRIRITDAASITRVPTITNIKLHSNHSEVNADGFVEFFGKSRPRNDINIPLRSFSSTGTAGETAPSTQRIVASTNPVTIASDKPNSLFANNTLTAMSTAWNPPLDIDTSSELIIKLTMSRGTGAAGNVAMRVDYVFIANDDVIGNPNGITTAIGKGTGIVTIATSAVSRGEFTGRIPLDIVGLNPNIHVLWMKISRAGSDAADTYNGDIYLNTITFSIVKWCLGGYYS